jgi:hypothetical protein
MSINKAQLTAIANGVLDSLGDNPAMYSPDNFTLEEKVLIACANEVARLLRESLQEKGGLASRELLQSIDASNTVLISGNEVAASVVGESHWKYFEYGRKRGKMPPIKVIEEWITSKGIRVRQNRGESKQTVMDRRRGMAFAIARKIGSSGTIKRFGYKGSGFVESVLTPENITIISEVVAQAYGRKLTIYATMGDT